MTSRGKKHGLFWEKLRTFLQGKKLWTFLLKNYVLFYKKKITDFFTKKLRTFLQGKKLWTFLLKNYVLFYTDFFTKNYVLFY